MGDVDEGADEALSPDHPAAALLRRSERAPTADAAPDSLLRRDHPWVCTGPEGLVGGGLVRRVASFMPLLRMWTAREFSARYRQSALDVLWSLVQPVATLAIYGSLLTGAFGVTGDGLPYLSFAWAGLAPWTFVANALAMCVVAISFEGSISKTYFPREVIPLAIVGAAFVDLVIQTVILFVLALVQGIRPSHHAVALVLVDLVLIVWVAAIGVFAAALAVFIRDVRHVTGLVLRLGFFASPIMYPVTQYPERFAWVVDVNPVAVAAEGTRDVLLRGTWPDWGVLLTHGLVGGVLLVLSLMYVRSVEPRMVDLA